VRIGLLRKFHNPVAVQIAYKGNGIVGGAQNQRERERERERERKKERKREISTSDSQPSLSESMYSNFSSSAIM